ncbi:HAF repeat-containing protein, partial [Singulisphaera rosea]
EAVPCLWTRGESGTWTREAIGDPSSLIPRAVNNRGTVVGLRYPDGGKIEAVIWTRDGGCRPLPVPAEYGKSEAIDVNNNDVVVGQVDGPPSSDKGPRAFVYGDKQLRLIDEAGPAFISATAINDRGQVAGVMEKQDEKHENAEKQK